MARLGNVEKSITYVCAWFDQIPKAGELYDDEYYISAVSWEVMPTYIKCTLGLSKDFNRISQYIGISSNRRYYEVSEREPRSLKILADAGRCPADKSLLVAQDGLRAT